MTLADLLRDLVIANRILAHEGVVDAYGHVSFRHPERPDRFFLSCSRSPELVTRDDIIEYDLDCNPVKDQKNREQYTERPIHGAIYRARPDVQAVIHNHAYEVIPFTVARHVKLRPLLHTSAGIGPEVPVWDIREKFGDTNLLVRTTQQGADLAAALGSNPVVLMRGHGAAVASDTIKGAVHTAYYLKINALLQERAMRFGDVTYLSEGEIAQMRAHAQMGHARAWEYWSRRAGISG